MHGRLIPSYHRYRSLDRDRRRLLRRSLLLLLQYRFVLALRPFRQCVRSLDVLPANVRPAPLEVADRAMLADVSWAVQVASRFTPWCDNCLIKALAAQRLLAARGLPGVLYLGTARPGASGGGPALAGHAWVMCGDDFVTGRFEHDAYRAITAFSWNRGT